MESRVKLDPLAYVLLLGVLGLQLYTWLNGRRDVEALLSESDRMYQAAVFIA